MSKQEIQNIIINTIRNHNPLLIGLFGSFARNESTNSSDIDILVKFNDTLSLLTLVDLENELSDKLGVKIDLVTDGAIKNDLVRNSIEKDLQIIYQA